MEGYNGDSIDGVDEVFELSGEFVSAVFRVMPHAAEPERFRRIADLMQSVKASTPSEYSGGEAKPIDDVAFPPVGTTDADVFESNLLEVLQFALNHTTLDPDNDMDQAGLVLFRPLGISDGKAFEPNAIAQLDGKRVRHVAEKLVPERLAMMQDS